MQVLHAVRQHTVASARGEGLSPDAFQQRQGLQVGSHKVSYALRSEAAYSSK